MAKFIIIGDPHLDKGLSLGKSGDGFSINSRLQDRFNLLDWALDKAHDNMCSHIIITGDVFEDTKPSWTTVNLFNQWLQKCEVYNINVVICIGNHELSRSGAFTSSPLDIINLPNVTICNDIQNFFIEDVGITILPFRDVQSFNVNSASEAYAKYQSKLKYWRLAIPTTYSKVLIGHQAITGSIWIGDEVDDHSKEIFIDEDFTNGYDYVWMGHVHKFQEFKTNKKVLAHIGSLDISDFGESSQKKYIALFDSTNSKYEYLELPTRPLTHIDLDTTNQTDPTNDILLQIDKLSIDFKSAIVRCEINNGTKLSVDRKAVENKILAKGAFSIYKIIEHKAVAIVTKNKTNTMSLSLDTNSTIKKWAESSLDKDDVDDFVSFCTDLIKEFNT